MLKKTSWQKWFEDDISSVFAIILFFFLPYFSIKFGTTCQSLLPILTDMFVPGQTLSRFICNFGSHYLLKLLCCTRFKYTSTCYSYDIAPVLKMFFQPKSENSFFNSHKKEIKYVYINISLVRRHLICFFF